MSEEKLVTHEDLDALRALRYDCSEFEKDEQRLLDRLIAAAEADQPLLPEPISIGTVVRAVCEHGTSGIFVKRDDDSWIALPGRGNRTLQQQSDTWGDLTNVEVLFDPAAAPLRLTVTEADVEKAAQAAAEESTGVSRDVWGVMPEGLKSLWRAVTRAAFEAAGIEVRP